VGFYSVCPELVWANQHLADVLLKIRRVFSVSSSARVRTHLCGAIKGGWELLCEHVDKALNRDVVCLVNPSVGGGLRSQPQHTVPAAASSKKATCDTVDIMLMHSSYDKPIRYHYIDHDIYDVAIICI
jgi:hypothetical protein